VVQHREAHDGIEVGIGQRHRSAIAAQHCDVLAGYSPREGSGVLAIQFDAG
jgi:hypothetical protein